MSVEMKLGRWMDRSGTQWSIEQHVPESEWPWRCFGGPAWRNDGTRHSNSTSNTADLIRYIGPLSPTPACADQAGTPVVSTVSTETAGEQLRRVNARLISIRSELGICRASVKDLERTESDLEELAKMLEREVEESPSGNHEAAACAVIQDERREG